MNPAPKARVQKGQPVTDADHTAVHAPEEQLIDLSEGQAAEVTKILSNGNGRRSNSPATFGSSPKTTFLRRSSSGGEHRIPVRGNVNDMREHLKHLGPSNLASRPKTTRYNTVKIKSGNQPFRSVSRTNSTSQQGAIIVEEPYRDIPAPQGGEGEGLLKSAGKDAKDGVQAVQQGYGSFERTESTSPGRTIKARQEYTDGASDARQSPKIGASGSQKEISVSRSDTGQSESSDTVGSLDTTKTPSGRKKGAARSGSITENIIEAGGIRKVILELNSSSDDEEDGSDGKNKDELSFHNVSQTGLFGQTDGGDDSQPKGEGEQVKKKRRRNRHKKKGGKSSEEGSGAGGSGH